MVYYQSHFVNLSGDIVRLDYSLKKDYSLDPLLRESIAHGFKYMCSEIKEIFKVSTKDYQSPSSNPPNPGIYVALRCLFG